MEHKFTDQMSAHSAELNIEHPADPKGVRINNRGLVMNLKQIMEFVCGLIMSLVNSLMNRRKTAIGAAVIGIILFSSIPVEARSLMDILTKLQPDVKPGIQEILDFILDNFISLILAIGLIGLFLGFIFGERAEGETLADSGKKYLQSNMNYILGLAVVIIFFSLILGKFDLEVITSGISASP